MNVRPPTVDGRFYPGDRSSIMKMLEEFFERARGLPDRMDNPPVKGVVVPHAGYPYSGPTATRSYLAIARGYENIDSFILLGPCHMGMGASVSISKMDFETPLGIVKNDQELSELLQNPVIRHSEEAHILEHSIEVQLPFLQYIAEIAGKDFTFVPIVMISQNIKSATAVGEAIHKAVKESGKRVAVISSSDFTHAGSAYGFMPCPRNRLIDWMYEHDKLALEKIKKLDIKGFMEVRDTYRLSICGSGPIGALLRYSHLSGAKEAKVLNYTTSYEVSRSLSGVVGYASIVVE